VSEVDLDVDIDPEVESPREPRVPFPVWLLAAFICLYIGVFATLTWRQQSNYGTFGFDMGIYDQGIWLLSRFREPFVTVRGLNYFGHHVNLITVLFVPFYWLGAGPHFLYVVETIALAAGAIPVYLLARDVSDDWLALVPAAAFLLYPAVEWTNWWHFHPDALMITPLLFAWWFAKRQKWRWYFVALVLALLAKEDAALAVTMMGVVFAIRGERKRGAQTFVLGLVWYLVCIKLIIPIANGGKDPFYEELYPGFGHSATEILWNMIRHPSHVWDFAVLPDRLEYYRGLVFPVALLAFLSPLPLLTAIPQLLANILSIHQPTHDIHFHYTPVITVAIFVATIEVFARVARRRQPWPILLSVVLLVSVAVSNHVDSPSPLGRHLNDTSVWLQDPTPKAAAIKRALSQVRPNDKVSASFYMVPQLSHRTYIYEYPNPFRATNWGVNGEDPPSADTVDTLVLDTTLTGDDTYLYSVLVGEGGPFKVVYERDDIVVARRKAVG
jgi:uncharacterized membrane protein